MRGLQCNGFPKSSILFMQHGAATYDKASLEEIRNAPKNVLMST
jgi:hypothetical protein